MKFILFLRTLVLVALFFVVSKIATAQTIQTMLNPNNPFLISNVEEIDPSGWLYFRASSTVKEGELFSNYKINIGLGTDDAMLFQKSELDSKGNNHNRYQQYHKGYLVEGAEMIEHLEDCKVMLVNGKLIESLNGNTTGIISEASALQSALTSIGATKYMWQDTSWENEIKIDKGDGAATYFPKGELVWAYPSLELMKPSDYKLTWVFTVMALTPYSSSKIYVNAKNGAFEKKANLDEYNGPGNTLYNGVQTLDTKWTGGLNHGHFHMMANDLSNQRIETKFGTFIPPTVLSGGISFGDMAHLHDENDAWLDDDIFSSSAHWGITSSWLYFRNKFGRSGWVGNGDKIKVIAGSAMKDNAVYRSGLGFVEFGTSTGAIQQLGPLGKNLAALDICGHEYTHGVVKNTAGLNASGESGALNESFADIFGVLIEQNTIGNTDWVIGNDLGGGGLRSVSNPDQIPLLLLSCGGSSVTQPINYMGDNWVPTSSPCDGGGIHINNGVQNRWFFLLSQGGTQNGITIQGIGTAKAAQIAYMNLTVFLASTSNYPASRVGSINAAKSLFGNCANEVVQTTNAWAAVNLGAPFTGNCVSISGEGFVCINDYFIPYSAVGLPNATFTWSYPSNWSATSSGSKNEKLKVNSFGTIPGSYSLMATSSLGGSSTKPIIVSNGTPCNHSLCGGSVDRNSERGNKAIESVISPNPSNGFVYVKTHSTNPVRLSYYNTDGSQVMEILNYLDGSEIDISKINNGVYFLLIEDGNTRTTHKFIKID